MMSLSALVGCSDTEPLDERAPGSGGSAGLAAAGAAGLGAAESGGAGPSAAGGGGIGGTQIGGAAGASVGASGAGGSGGASGGSGGAAGTPGGGAAGAAGAAGGGIAGSPGSCGSSLVGSVRDFRETFPDMEIVQHNPSKQYVHDPGMVQRQLGADGKPVYAGPAGGTLSTSGPDAFWHWYNDSDQNLSMQLELRLKDTGYGTVAIDSNADAEWQPPLGPGGFFPLDDAGFGNESAPAH